MPEWRERFGKTVVSLLLKGISVFNRIQKDTVTKKQTFYCTENMQYKSMTRDYKQLLSDALRNITCELKEKDMTVLDSIK